MADLYRTGKQYADQARKTEYDKFKYENMDCQAFCERVLKDIGVRNSNGQPYNWKGSNDIARHACSWIGTKEDCIKAFGFIPLGAWAFIWENKTGKEKERGYNDGLGNYSHIGIYIGDDIVRDSTRYKNSSGEYVRDGVGNRSINAFNRVGLAKMLDFGESPSYNDHDKIMSILGEIRNKLSELEGLIK